MYAGGPAGGRACLGFAARRRLFEHRRQLASHCRARAHHSPLQPTRSAPLYPPPLPACAALTAHRLPSRHVSFPKPLRPALFRTDVPLHPRPLHRPPHLPCRAQAVAQGARLGHVQASPACRQHVHARLPSTPMEAAGNAAMLHCIRSSRCSRATCMAMHAGSGCRRWHRARPPSARGSPTSRQRPARWAPAGCLHGMPLARCPMRPWTLQCQQCSWSSCIS